MTGSSGLLDDVGQLLKLALGSQQSTQLSMRVTRGEKVIEVECKTGKEGGGDQVKVERKTGV